jgi:hypothetical protein
MIITRHVGIHRYGKHEIPVTIIDDDGRLFDTVLYFDKAPSVPNINAAASAYVAKIKESEGIPVEEVSIQLSEVKSVLIGKGLMEVGETWDEWKSKPITMNARIKEEAK